MMKEPLGGCTRRIGFGPHEDWLWAHGMLVAGDRQLLVVAVATMPPYARPNMWGVQHPHSWGCYTVMCVIHS